MDNDLILHISSFTLRSRKALEDEASEQLEGLYGWLPDGSFADTSSYPALRTAEEARTTRKALEEYAFAEEESGDSYKETRKKLVRETAFTWLNRLVALRMMEERNLLRTVISKLHESAGYLFWLTENTNAGEYKLHEEGESPVNPAGEGPRNTAYRRFIIWQCYSLSKEIPVLFDTSDLPSRLFPRPIVLRDFILSMNREELADAWKKGNEETLGWVYQAFNSEELQAAFAGAREQKKKFTPEDIPAVTQLFTIRWVVRFLVENSLGKLWLDIHPDSSLKDKLVYLVSPDSNVTNRLKLAKDISFLDPACGSMHFGLVAFDLFYEMYKEELEKNGQEGWPDIPSVNGEEYIPGAIIENNLHGMDIDLRAVQLSALALFLKARGKNPKCYFNDSKLLCANIEAVTGGCLEKFIESAKLQNPVYERILIKLAQRLKDSENMGSLLRLEEELKKLIFEERSKAKVVSQKTLGLDEVEEDLFENSATMVKFFDTLEESIQKKLDDFIRETGKRNSLSMRFAHETSKGLCFLKLISKQYDVVATNPPYLSNRKMNKRLAELLEESYPEGKQDLYAAFIKRCSQLLSPSGLMGMLTMHSFMFISSYALLRQKLIESVNVEVMAHFGGGLFSVGNPATLQTTAFVLRKEANDKTRKEREGIFFRLVKGKNAEEKRLAFEEAVEAWRSGKKHPLVFLAKLSDFEAVPGKPWVYWMPQRLMKLFSKLDLIGTVAQPRQGLATADNNRFLRSWWEVGKTRIGFRFSSTDETKEAKEKWFPYMKGGTSRPWYGNQEHVVNWNENGAAIRCFGQEEGKIRSRPQNVDFYFRPGVTWSLISSKGFAARLSPGGFIFDVAGMTSFPPKEHIWLVLAVMNSKAAKFILSALNPTINFQVGDIERLPVPQERSSIIDNLVQDCVDLTRRDSRESEATYEFVAPADSVESVSERKQILSEKEALLNTEVSRLYGLSEEDLAAIDLELLGNLPDTFDEGVEDEASEAEEDEAPFELSVDEWGRRWISYAAGIALGRFEPGVDDSLGCGDFSPSVVEELREKHMTAPDGILLNDEGEPLDLSERVYSILELLLGTASADERIKAALGEGNSRSLLLNWFDRFTGQPANSFWKYHFQMYRKRPVYWPLQSPGRKFTVWVFHERITKDTLYSIRNTIIEPRIRLAERNVEELRVRSERDRSARQELERTIDLADDLRAFSAAIKAVTDRGYYPRIDDGVLLNASPLWTLLPSWPETKKAWQSLEEGEYDWSGQAMEYWPERVKKACIANRSYAIFHGLEYLCPQLPDPTTRRVRGRRGGNS